MKRLYNSTRTLRHIFTLLLFLSTIATFPSPRLFANLQSAEPPAAHLDSVQVTGSQRYTSAQIA
ncbi:MAG: hypothetical protein WCC67_05840, partial [Candidatus Acidiferrales bacterium]